MCRSYGPVSGILHEILEFVIRHCVHSGNSKSTSTQVVATCVKQCQQHFQFQLPGDTALIGAPPVGSKCRC